MRERVIKGMSPDAPFYYFEEISAIPRASGNESGIADYLTAFAAKRKLFYCRDEANNVLIRKKATEGREGEDTVLLQAHTDMVAEKNSGVQHDFEREGVSLIREGNILHADGTTLGADDGFGVALMLAILDNETASHPALECLFTTSEEVGLVGIRSFDFRLLHARKIINLDSAEENTVIVGCCGGVRSDLTLPIVKKPGKTTGFLLEIGGLCGGHSGEDIDRGRLNAHILMGKILRDLWSVTPFVLADINGGGKDNAIPRECSALVIPVFYGAAGKFFETAEARARAEIRAKEDEGLYLRVKKQQVESACSTEDTANVMRILELENGVLERKNGTPSLSRNLARIETREKDIFFRFSARSPMEEGLDRSCHALDTLAAALGASTSYGERYPGWESSPDAEIVRDYRAAYRKVTGKDTVPTVIHAGLECGLLSDALRVKETISVGANVFNLHTPREYMELDSLAHIYESLLTFLA